MPTKLGIRPLNRLAADFVIASNVVPQAIGVTGDFLNVNVAALARVHLRAVIGFSVGATGGLRFQWVIPAAPGNFRMFGLLVNTVTPTITPFTQSASAVFTNALAVAGVHYLEMEVDYTNGVNAGVLSFQAAQNTSDVLALTFLQGAWVDYVLL